MTDRENEAAEIMRALIRDLRSPFPREVVVVADLGMGGTSIERAVSWIQAVNPNGETK